MRRLIICSVVFLLLLVADLSLMWVLWVDLGSPRALRSSPGRLQFIPCVVEVGVEA